MKGINYVASVVKVYREAIDTYYENPEAYSVKDYWIDELSNVSSRGLSTGFYFGDPDQVLPNYTKNNPTDAHLFLGKVIQKAGGYKAHLEVRNKIFKGESVEILGRKGPVAKDKILDISDTDGQSLPFAQPGNKVTVLMNNECFPNDLIRRVKII